jgi:hypothetical protein
LHATKKSIISIKTQDMTPILNQFITHCILPHNQSRIFHLPFPTKTRLENAGYLPFDYCDFRQQVASLISHEQVTLLETDMNYSENDNFLSFKPAFQADLLTALQAHHTNDFTTMTVFLVYNMQTPMQNPVSVRNIDFKTDHDVRKTKAAMKEAQMQAQLTRTPVDIGRQSDWRQPNSHQHQQII